MVCKIRSSDYRTIKCKGKLNLRKKREKLAKIWKLDKGSARTQGLKIPLENKFAPLLGEYADSVDMQSVKLTSSTESEAAVGKTPCRKQTGELTQGLKQLRNIRA